MARRAVAPKAAAGRAVWGRLLPEVQIAQMIGVLFSPERQAAGHELLELLKIATVPYRPGRAAVVLTDLPAAVEERKVDAGPILEELERSLWRGRQPEDSAEP